VSAKSEVYSLLAGNAELNALLARSSIEGAEQQPAIYDAWPGENAAMPYIICSWQFPEGNHWAQVKASLDLDIYTSGGDTTEAEAIKDLCLKILAWEQINTPGEGQINIYFGGNDGELQEPDPQVTHWNINFLVKYWRQSLIAAVTNK
jgi:hypothetical protein